MSVIHDGIRTGICTPDTAARLTLPNGLVLSRDDEVVTYVSRNLEPYRGFDRFLRALQELLKRRPPVYVVLLGGDEDRSAARLAPTGNGPERDRKGVGEGEGGSVRGNLA